MGKLIVDVECFPNSATPFSWGLIANAKVFLHLLQPQLDRSILMLSHAPQPV